MQQAVEIATEVSKNLAQNSASDGVLGLGFSNLNKGRSTFKEYQNIVLFSIRLTIIV
jgi:hypothetical protein